MWDVQRSTLIQAVDIWKTQIRAVNRHRAAINDVLTDIKKTNDAAKIDFRKSRDTYRRWLVGRGVPEALAKSSGDTLREEAGSAQSIGMQLDYVRPPSLHGPLPISSFESPSVIEHSKVPAEKRSALQSYFTGLVESHESKVLNNKKDCLEYLKKNEIDQCMTSTKLSTPFALPGESLEEHVSIVPDLKMVIWFKKTFSWSCMGMCNPYKTTPVFLTQFSMHSIVVLLPPQVVSSFSNADEWLVGLESEALLHYPTVLLTDGNTLFCPLGWCPVVLTLPCCVNYSEPSPALPLPSRRGAEQFHHGFIGVNFLLAESVASAMSSSTRATAYSLWNVNRSNWHDCMCKQAITDYYEKVQPRPDKPHANITDGDKDGASQEEEAFVGA